MPAATVIDEYVSKECYAELTCRTVRIYLTASTDAVITNLPDNSYVCDAPDVGSDCCTLVPSCIGKMV